MNVGSLFSGIGGLDLGLERAGMRVKWQCEIDPYCRAVLAHHWPGIPCYEDIKTTDWTAVEPVDLICGGFPCQPVSSAGKRLAQEDPRWLWPEMARVVGNVRPRYVVVENVRGLVRRGLMDVVTDLAHLGYDAEWQIVSAASVGAPHLRERLFVVAADTNRESEHARPVDAEMAVAQEPLPHSQREQLRIEQGRSSGKSGANPSLAPVDGEERDVAHADSQAWYSQGTASEEIFRPEAVERSRRRSSSNNHWATEPDVGRVAHGVPNRLAQLRALGNAVVPQVAETVGRMIMEAA